MRLLLGAAVRQSIESERLAAIAKKGESVCIALFRVGEREDDRRYERSILRACERLGILTE